MTRTLEESLARAQNLRDLRFRSPRAFSRSYDFQDIVNLADEIQRLNDLRVDETPNTVQEDGCLRDSECERVNAR